MPLGATCPKCKQALALGTSLAGQQFRCPRCGCVFQISPPAKTAQKKETAPLPDYLKSDTPSQLPTVKGIVAKQQAPLPKTPPTTKSTQTVTKSGPLRSVAKVPLKNNPTRKRRSLLKPLSFLFLIAMIAGGSFGVYHLWPRWFGTPDDSYFLPDQCQMVASIDVRACLASKAHQLLKSKGEGLEAEEETVIRGLIGVPLSEIVSVTIGGRLDDDLDWVTILHSSQIVSPHDLQPEGAPELRESRVGKYTVYERADDAFILPDKHTLVFGKPETLQRVLLRNRESTLFCLSRIWKNAPFGLA